MAYKVKITSEAISDVYVFYGNVSIKYPNTWTVHDAIAQADKVVDEISSAIIEGLDGYQSPLLVYLQTNGMAESSTEDNNWYYTVRLEGEYAIVENAVYKGNESNRAFRRGTAKPNFPLNKDHRNTPPVYNKNNTPYTVHKVLENGFSIVKSNSKNPLYSLVHTDTGQFVINDWFKNIKPLNLPYGRLGIIAYVNDNGSLSCLSTDGKLYGMNRSWNDAFTESKKLDSIIRRVIREEVEKSKDIEWWEYSKPDEGWDPSFYGHVNDKKNLEKEHKYYMEYAKFEPNPSMENFEYKKMQKLLKNYDGRAIHLSLM